MNLVSKMFGVTTNTPGVFMRFTTNPSTNDSKLNHIEFTLKASDGEDCHYSIKNLSEDAVSNPDILLMEHSDEILNFALDHIRQNVKPTIFNVDSYIKGFASHQTEYQQKLIGTSNLINTMLMASQQIAVKTRRGAANVIFISSNLARSLKSNSNSAIIDFTSLPNTPHNPCIGKLLGSIDLYELPSNYVDEIFITYKGKHIGEYGFNILVSNPTINQAGEYNVMVKLEGGLIGGYNWFEYIKIE